MDKIICNLCNREYSSKYSLSNHKRIKHKNENTPKIYNDYTNETIIAPLKKGKRAENEPISTELTFFVLSVNFVIRSINISKV